MSTETADRHQWTTDGELPRMVINYPTCGHCGNDVFIDPDTISCEACLVTWDRVDEDAKPYPTDSEAAACGATCEGTPRREEYEHKGRMYRLGSPQPCILPAGHTSEHRHPYEAESWPALSVTAGVDAGTGEAGGDV